MTEALASADPGAVPSAVNWLEAGLLGTSATTVAVIAVATIGFLMLSGRVDVRRAGQVVLGCFIIFGASTIANGIVSAIAGGGSGADLAQDSAAAEALSERIAESLRPLRRTTEREAVSGWVTFPFPT